MTAEIRRDAIADQIFHAVIGAQGVGDVAVLPIEHDFWRFYRLDP